MSEDLNLDLLDVEELCALLKVSKKWVYREVENERLPVVRLGRSLRFFRSDIVAYLRKDAAQQQAS